MQLQMTDGFFFAKLIMRFLSRRQVRKFISEWVFLYLFLIGFFFLLRSLGWLREENIMLIPFFNKVDKDDPQLEHIRRKHLYKYDPSAPTDYTGGHQGWLQKMSKTVAKRLNHKRDGFFVECRAQDGVYLSNSLLLETRYDWTGLLIEADPKSVSKLKQRNRNAWVADVCLSPKPQPMTVEMEVAERSVVVERVFSGTVKVACYPLAMLMDAINRTEIDYLSLDVEGTELDVLQTVPFDRIRIKLISVEEGSGNSQEISNFLESFGYKRIRKIVMTNEQIAYQLYELQV